MASYKIEQSINPPGELNAINQSTRWAKGIHQSISPPGGANGILQKQSINPPGELKASFKIKQSIHKIS